MESPGWDRRRYTGMISEGLDRWPLVSYRQHPNTPSRLCRANGTVLGPSVRPFAVRPSDIMIRDTPLSLVHACCFLPSSIVTLCLSSAFSLLCPLRRNQSMRCAQFGAVELNEINDSTTYGGPFASMKSNPTGVRPGKIVRLAEGLGDMLELCVALGAFGGSHCGWFRQG